MLKCTTLLSKRIQRCVGFFLFILLVAVMFIEFSSSVSTSPGDGWSASTWFHLYSPAGKSSQGATLSTLGPTGLTPAQIRKAYNLPSSGGSGTIAIIDAYDCPSVLSDLTVFSSQFALPAPNSTNFEKHKMTGTIAVDAGWAFEISLDVQWAHAIAPNAKILLVEAQSASLGDLLAAVNYAKNRADVSVVSMSWGGSEFSGQSSLNSYFTSNHGVVFFASTGDSGAGVIWPSTSQNVVAVGGTSLALNPDGSVVSETGWSGSGGGISAYETEPQYQITYNIPVANGKRCVPDVSYDGNPATGFPVYDTTAYEGQTGWFQVGGTSAGAPQWAAIQSLGLSITNNNLYQDAKWSGPTYFRDITSGSNGAYSAAPGYDLVTGLGSPITWNYTTGIGSDFSISTSPSTITAQNGTIVRSNITVTSVNGFAGKVTFSINSPGGWNASLNSSSIVIPLGGSNQSALSETIPSTANAGTYNVTIAGFSGSLSHNATLSVTVTLPLNPHIAGFNIVSGGGGYTTPVIILSGGGGTGATATARVSNGVIFGVMLTSQGTGYTSAPSVSIRDPSPRAKGASAITLMGP
jgi:subtilase family serine protease